MSQNNILINWLNDGNSITPLEAFNRWGMLRLGARIHDIKSTLPIDSEFVKVVNRLGDECRVKNYWMSRG